MHSFCTYFDHRYLARGLALYESLTSHSGPFKLWILCLDQPCYDALQKINLEHARLIKLEDLERGDNALLEAKKNRSLIEYYFTCTPSLMLYVLNQDPGISLLTYLDADLFFFDSPQKISEETRNASIAIVPHRFPKQYRFLEIHGIYNVGWVSFRRDEEGLRCAKRWREQCIEWCYDYCEEKRFGDQKYLDEWPSLYKNLVIIRQKGTDLVPWNVLQYKISHKDGSVFIDRDPLIFYHFHALKFIKSWLIHPNLLSPGFQSFDPVMKLIYQPYLEVLGRMQAKASEYLKHAPVSAIRKGEAAVAAPPVPGESPLRRMLLWAKGLLTKQYVILWKGRIL